MEGENAQIKKRGNVVGKEGSIEERQRCGNKGSEKEKERRGSMLVIVNLRLAVERGEAHVQIYGCLLG